VEPSGFWACLAAIRQPELYSNFAVHLLVMLPAAIAMCFIATKVDAVLGLDRLIPWPLAAWLGLAAIGVGGFWVWYVYGFLYLAGQGSPGTHVDGGPSALVDTGPYAAIRHPSVLGKILGVAGLGLMFGSPVFLFAFLPVLLLYSVLTNRYLQERNCERRFGDLYRRYREVVPMLIPRPSGIRRWWRGQAALTEPGPRPSEQAPATAKRELPLYLVGLTSLILLFALVALLVSLLTD
jgi:protein-S-isoprenylcysteine O-methyltransferase Ste14